MKLRLLIVVLGLAASVGCKVESKGSTESRKEFYSYDFTENGCKTYPQSSNTVEGICKKLEDHALNRYCAYGLRAAEYNRYNCFNILGSKPSLAPSERAGTSTTFMYELSENGCGTGKHVFGKRKDLCDGLKDEELNNGCAKSIREKMLQANRCD